MWGEGDKKNKPLLHGRLESRKKKRKAHSKKAQPEDCAHPTNPRQGD